MGSIGGGNPIPFEIGGGPSETLQTYEALKVAVGVGGSAEDGTIEAEWRLAKARGLAAMMADRRAAHQAWPDTATDHIPVYEELLDTVAAPGESDEARRRVNTDLWTQAASAVSSVLEGKLQEINSLFSLVTPDRDTARTCVPGRSFEDFTPADPDACGPAFGGGRSATEWPNYSSDFICGVLFAVPAGTLTPGTINSIERAKAVLNENLSAWVGFFIMTTTTGFVLDQDLLDVGAFGS